MRTAIVSKTRVRQVVGLIFSMIICLFLPRVGRAQVSGASLSGTIADPSGSFVGGATVTIENEGTGVVRDVSSDASGLYAAPNLLPGLYEITVSAPGFSTQIQKGVTLTVGAQQVLNFTLKIGSANEKVEVTSEAPTVQLASSEISAVVDSTTVRELPINGRSWSDLATLQPGVSQVGSQRNFTSGGGRGNRGYGAQVTISGARPQQNNYRLDGVSLNDYANGGPGSVLGGNLGVDAIQEFSVITTNYSAEYGRTSGGVVNAVSRAGTDDFHGNAYEFLRNSALDARNFFDPLSGPPAFKRNQFGASGGGPIIKKHTFVFADYEGIRQSEGVSTTSTVPSPEARQGNLTSGPVTVSPGAQLYLALFPTTPSCGADTCKFRFAANQKVSENFFTARVDHRFSEKDSLFGTYLYDKTPFTTPDNLDAVLLGQLSKRQAFILEENHIFNATLVNTVRFGFNRDYANTTSGISAINPAAHDAALATLPGQFASELTVGGLSAFGGSTGGSNFFFRWNSFQGYDDAFLTRGLHSIKFGVAVERDQDNQTTTDGQAGKWFFGSLSNFLQNIPSRYIAALPGRLTERGMRQTIFGAYVQDDWRVRPHLTLNLGLRYETSTVPTEVHGKLSNLYNLTDATPHIGNPYFLNPTRRNFAPRVGFAWDAFGNGKTAVRGGFGIFDSLPMLYELVTLNGRAAPFFESATIRNNNGILNNTFPNLAFPLLVAQGASGLEYGSVERKPKRNYVMQWNLNIQEQLTPNLTAFVGYVGTRGVHQPFRADDANLVLPTLTSAGYLWPSPQGSGTVVNPNAGDIRYLNWGGGSSYNALQVGLTKRMSHGLQLQGSYTWGKSIDTNSGVIAGDTFTNSISSLPWFNLKIGRAVSDFNVPRTLVISSTWEVPEFKSLTGPASWVANGWELGLIFKANDGTPFTPTFGTDGDPLGLNSSDPWDVASRLSGPGCGTLVNPGNPNNYIKTQCFALPSAPSQSFYAANCDPAFAFPVCINLRGNAGRNILTGPALANVDFSIFKNNRIRRISESFNVQFRVEIFNILNHANFAVPVTPDNTDLFDSTGASLAGNTAGFLSSTSTSSRQIQLALKVIW